MKNLVIAVAAGIAASFACFACSPQPKAEPAPTPIIIYVTPGPAPTPITIYVTPGPAPTPIVVYLPPIPPGECGPLDHFYHDPNHPFGPLLPCPR